MAALFCDVCLTLEIDDDWRAQLKIGFRPEREPAKDFLSMPIGFQVVPLTLGQKESDLIVEEIQSDWMERQRTSANV